MSKTRYAMSGNVTALRCKLSDKARMRTRVSVTRGAVFWFGARWQYESDQPTRSGIDTSRSRAQKRRKRRLWTDIDLRIATSLDVIVPGQAAASGGQ